MSKIAGITVQQTATDDTSQYCNMHRNVQEN